MQTSSLTAEPQPRSAMEESSKRAARKVVLISCGKTKHNAPTTAADLYRGDLFIKSLAFARTLEADAIYILSAKYGLLELNDRVEPYELTLKTLPAAARREWAAKVLQKLGRWADLRNDEFVFLAGDEYRRHLMPQLNHTSAPLQGLRFGEQLAWLSR